MAQIQPSSMSELMGLDLPEDGADPAPSAMFDIANWDKL
jgi:hypothetical protein